jgi:hypothetical protein
LWCSTSSRRKSFIGFSVQYTRELNTSVRARFWWYMEVGAPRPLTPTILPTTTSVPWVSAVWTIRSSVSRPM